MLTTSDPSALEKSVLDRMDETIRLTVPDEQEQESLFRQESERRFEQVVASGSGGSSSSVMNVLSYCYRGVTGKTQTKLPIAAAMDLDAMLSVLVKDTMTKGFSGRELLKIVMAVSADIYLMDTLTLDTKLWNKATSRLCRDILVKKRLKDKRSK